MDWPTRNPYTSTCVPLFYFRNKMFSLLFGATYALLPKNLHDHHTKISLYDVKTSEDRLN